MAINFPGPYEVELSYPATISGLTLTHVTRLNCAAVGTPTPGTPVSAIQLQTISGAPADLQDCVDDLWNRVRIFFHTTVIAGSFVLWKYTPGTFEKTFIASGTLTNPAGTNATAPVPAHYIKMSFRSAGGGIVGITLLEDSQGGDTQVLFNADAGGDGYEQLAAYIISSAGWILARDDSFPIVAYRLSFGENEALWKARFR